MRIAQVVIGPAGSGKSTFAAHMCEHLRDSKRDVVMVNLDPAAEEFKYDVDIDVRDLISVADVMEADDLRLGPNGGLIFCVEYLLSNIEWLGTRLEEAGSDYLIIDCPGQIELYTHLDVFQRVLQYLTNQQQYTICILYLMDGQFMSDCSKFLGGALSALSSMVALELPHINVLSKLDLLDSEGKKRLEQYLEFEGKELLADLSASTPAKYQKLNEELANLIDSYSLVMFHPLDYSDEESLENLLLVIDRATQYGEDVEFKDEKLGSAPEIDADDWFSRMA